MSESSPGLVTPYQAGPALVWDVRAPVAAPLPLHRASVPADWVDYNGHMSESCYLRLAGDAADALFGYLGIDDSYRAAGHSLYTVETHLRHLGEAALGDPLSVTGQLLGFDAKRLHLFLTVRRCVAGGDATVPGAWPGPATGQVVCTVEQLLVHVDMTASRAVPMPAELATRVRRVGEAHAGLPVPDGAGRAVSMARPG